MTAQTIQFIQLAAEFVIALALLIFVHEFGHFIVCKLTGIQVEEFGFGFPPRALTLFERGGTKFTLNWIPLGGFVRPKGEQDPSVEGGMAAANPWKRIAVLLAGPAMNMLTAVVLFIIIYAILGYLPDRSRIQLVEITANSPASAAGLQVGDYLLSVGTVNDHNIDAVRAVINANLGKPLLFVYERNGVSHDVTIIPRANAGSAPPVGIGMTYPLKSYTIWGAIPEGFTSISEYFKQLVGLLSQVVRGQAVSSDARPVGIVGMFQLYTYERENVVTPGVPTIANVMAFFASISIALGITNLLPIPALDGGRILFAIPEILIRRRIPQKYEVWLNLISFAILILLMIFINLNDIIHPIPTPTP